MIGLGLLTIVAHYVQHSYRRLIGLVEALPVSGQTTCRRLFVKLEITRVARYIPPAIRFLFLPPIHLSVADLLDQFPNKISPYPSSTRNGTALYPTNLPNVDFSTSDATTHCSSLSSESAMSGLPSLRIGFDAISLSGHKSIKIAGVAITLFGLTD